MSNFPSAGTAANIKADQWVGRVMAICPGASRAEVEYLYYQSSNVDAYDIIPMPTSLYIEKALLGAIWTLEELREMFNIYVDHPDSFKGIGRAWVDSFQIAGFDPYGARKIIIDSLALYE